MGRFHHELVGKGGVLGFEERLAHGLVGSLFLGIYNEDTIFASTDTPNVGDHVGDVPETKLTERQQKKLNLIKESPTVTGKQMSETLIADVTALVNIILGK